jgi:phosphohistidine phosphatase
MGRLLSEEGLLPDLILCSTAQRARSTAELVAEESDYQGEIIYNQEVYSFDAEPYRQALAALADDYETVMLVGHNPAIEEFLLSLTGKPEAMPTAALAQVELPIQSWAEMKRPVRGKLVEVWRPKEI